MDGRLDVYTGRTFDNALILSREPGSSQWKSLVQQYDFDCVLTQNAPEAAAFAADPQWQLVFTYPHSAKRAQTARIHPFAPPHTVCAPHCAVFAGRKML